MDRKILGILGGMGPLATAHFFQDILNWTEAEKDWDHLRIIIDNNVDIPSRTRALLYGEESPVELMREACFVLMAAGCEHIAVPCNSAHAFYDEVIENTNIPWVSMIKVVSQALTDRKNVLVLGGYSTITNKTYDRYLNNTIYLEANELVYQIIEDIKIGETDYFRMGQLYNRINEIAPDCVLLGCTELPMVFDRYAVRCDVADGNRIYVRKLIEMCGGTVKDE